MDSRTWIKIETIVNEAFDLTPDQQDVLIKRRCDGDKGLEKEVRSLMAADACADKVFDQLAEPADEDLTLTVMEAAKTFDKYSIIEKIGSGGMGVVYHAIDNRLDRPIAIKFLSPKLILDEGVRQRFITEAKAASRIDHPNICVIYDIDESIEHQLYFTMPYYEGQTLPELIESGELALGDAVEYAIQICSGVKAAHQHDILHRDIKPGNILVTRAGVVKVLDFGIAKILDSDVTITGELSGSTSYMSPEQTQGLPLDVRSDIWSFGVVLFEMFIGERPFFGKLNLDIAQAILNQPLPTFQEMGWQGPPLLEQIIQKALQRDLRQRYSSMSDLLWDLKQLQQQVMELKLAPEKLRMLKKVVSPREDVGINLNLYSY